MEKEEEAKKKPKEGKTSSKVYKKILLSVHGLTLVLSVIIFICGLVTNLNHLAYHEAWHASYGIYNGSVLSMVIGIILMAISILGKRIIVLITSYFFSHGSLLCSHSMSYDSCMNTADTN